MKKELEVYIHIPFCARKCAYCDFLSAPASSDTMHQYLEALLQEIREFPWEEEYEVSTVFFGGGTPSILPAEWIGRILETLEERQGNGGSDYAGRVWKPVPAASESVSAREITIECNPGTADFEKLRAYHEMGINRLSLGLQSADDQELKCLGRIHTWEEFLDTYQAARRAGFENINIDLMSALPGQTEASWESTLKKVLALKPEHISAYSLIVEEGTPFYERYEEDVKRREAGEACIALPSEEEERRMYALTEQYLASAGMYRYEISNYAKPGYECRHNIGYWRRTDYVGFGLGASSLLKNVRYRNPEDLSSYLKRDFSGREKEKLTIPDQMSEFMFLGLRMTEGVSEQKYSETFGVRMEEIYAEPLRKLIDENLICRKNGQVYLTDRGRDLANPVMAEFLLD
ncbi:MAG: radical SAM family heme chaperone HemW [Lachnospiraceae bacterium]|nr:radical SAM family heme chaperone HemW [Lachnospiraceae bacterium]